MILPAQAGAAKVAIHRFGEESSILEPSDNDGATDGYGKKGGDSWNVVATEAVVRIYTRGSSPTQNRVSGGRYRTESPVLLFAGDSVVEEGFRVSYGEFLYEIDSLLIYPSHIEAETTAVK